MKHDWEPADSQGYAMECARCGVYISIESSDWDKEIDANYHKPIIRGNRARLHLYEDIVCESCTRNRMCRFEVPAGEKCDNYIRKEM